MFYISWSAIYNKISKFFLWVASHNAACVVQGAPTANITDNLLNIPTKTRQKASDFFWENEEENLVCTGRSFSIHGIRSGHHAKWRKVTTVEVVKQWQQRRRGEIFGDASERVVDREIWRSSHQQSTPTLLWHDEQEHSAFSCVASDRPTLAWQLVQTGRRHG